MRDLQRKAGKSEGPHLNGPSLTFTDSHFALAMQNHRENEQTRGQPGDYLNIESIATAAAACCPGIT